jgi:hypothetical protein
MEDKPMFDSTRGASREEIDLEEYKALLANGTITADDRRRRPLWFDGRFLDAAALNSEQNYILGRQADIARVAGVGVVNGLEIEHLGDRARSVKISAGHGITPAGEMVMIGDATVIDLADVPEIRRLDASFGIAEIPKQTAINRSGLYILALRPVEYTGHPVASYPTSINGTRSVEDGHIIEATAITLIPYPDQSARVELDQRRKHVAREIFIDASTRGQPTGVLPLAMIALNLGVIQWLDMFMARREVGALDHDIFGLGLSPRALKEAYLRQYYNQLFEILDSGTTGLNRMTASEHFSALPAAGPMPAASIDSTDFTQSFFPTEMDVDLSIIAEDELPALIEDSYALPAIDLTLQAEQFESTSIMVVIPVSRARLRQLSLTLRSLTHPILAAAPGLVAKRKPITALRTLDLRKFTSPFVSVDPDTTSWRQELASVETLWYIRRRNLSYRQQVVSLPIGLVREESVIESAVTERFKLLGLTNTVGNIKRRGTTLAEGEIMNLFSSPVMLEAPEVTVKAAVKEINSLETVDRASVLAVTERFTVTDFGEGVTRLENANPTLTSSKKKTDLLAASGKLPEIDLLSKSLSPQEFEKFSGELADATRGTTASSENVATLVDQKIATLDPATTTAASRNQLEARSKVTGVKTFA